MKIDMMQFRETFFAEAAEHLATIEADLLRLDRCNQPDRLLDNIFRAAHSIKGGAGIFEFTDVVTFTHRLETLFDQMRHKEVSVTPALVELLLQANDMQGVLLKSARQNLPVPEGMNEMLTELSRHSTNANDATTIPVSTETFVTKTNHHEYRIFVTPSADVFRQGIDPLLLLRNLATMGEVTESEMAASVPGLTDCEPETCYLAWSLRLRSACSREAMLEEIAFYADSIQVVIEQIPDAEVRSTPNEGAKTASPASPEAHAETSSVPQTFSENREMLGDFVTEACEHLEATEKHLLILETNPTRRDSLDVIYRAFHTIKGISSFFNLQDITALAHAAEDLLNLVRDGKIVLTGRAFDLALASVDGLKRLIDLVRGCLVNGGTLQHDEQLAPLVAALKAIINGTDVPLPVIETITERTPIAVTTNTTTNMSKLDVPVTKTSSPPQGATANQGGADWAEKEIVKVDRDRLDKLVNVIGELVIGESMVGQEFAEWQAATGRESVALPQLKKIVRDLQEMSLSLRMVPVGATFQKMNRIVRDVAKKLGKEIQFHTQGDETEIDKTVVDQIGDPLMHMVRNAADHGIESPEQRIAAGKSASGNVTLRAFHQGGNIFIELEDDGKGLDRAAIMRKALERGLVTEGIELSDAEICDLIFKPGFSTATVVTDVSGRGVGMDVVRRNVEALQGNVSVRSKAGHGSVVTIRLPLTMAILDGLTVSLCGQTYIMPLVSVVESFRPRPSEVKRIAGKGEVVLVREEVLPLLRMQRLFNLQGKTIDPSQALVVIIEDQGRKCAILVDELFGQAQVVIKNLETNFRKVEGIAGATVLGDGRIALILDIHGLLKLNNRPVITSEFSTNHVLQPA